MPPDSEPQIEDATAGELQPDALAQPVRHLEVCVRCAGDLQVDALRRTALVELAGRVQEARPVAVGGGGPGGVADRAAQLQGGLVDQVRAYLLRIRGGDRKWHEYADLVD